MQGRKSAPRFVIFETLFRLVPTLPWLSLNTLRLTAIVSTCENKWSIYIVYTCYLLDKATRTNLSRFMFHSWKLEFDYIMTLGAVAISLDFFMLLPEWLKIGCRFVFLPRHSLLQLALTHRDLEREKKTGLPLIAPWVDWWMMKSSLNCTWLSRCSD